MANLAQASEKSFELVDVHDRGFIRDRVQFVGTRPVQGWMHPDPRRIRTGQWSAGLRPTWRWTAGDRGQCARTSPAEHRWGGTRDRSTCVPGGLLVRWSSDRTCRGHVSAPGLSRPGSWWRLVSWLRRMWGCGSTTRIRRSAGVGAPLLVVVAGHEPPVDQQ